jgi:hypothetical protein
VSDSFVPSGPSRRPSPRASNIALALFFLVPVAAFGWWFYAANQDDGWDVCKPAIEAEFDGARSIEFSPGEHAFTEAGDSARASGTVVVDGAPYGYQCSVDNGLVTDVRVTER